MGAVKKLYVNERHLVSLEEVKTDTPIHNPDGTAFLAVAGEMLATNQFGEQYTVPKSTLLNTLKLKKLNLPLFMRKWPKDMKIWGRLT